MLNYLLNIQEYNFMGLGIVDLNNFVELLLRFVFNMAVMMVIVRYIYYPTTRRKDYLFSFLLIGALIFLLCYLLENVKLQIGFAFGLFAIFGILRYRTLAIPIKEMTYLFILIGLSVVNALAGKKISWVELVFTNFMLGFLTFGLEKLWLLKHESSKQIIYEKIDLIVPQKRDELIQDLEARTGLKINRVDIGRIDFLRDVAKIIVYYYDDDNHINQADEYDNAYVGGDDDD
jgi:hypothetical protein